MSIDLSTLQALEGARGFIALSRKDGSISFHSENLDPSDCAEVITRLRAEIGSAPGAVSRLRIFLDDSIVFIFSVGEEVIVLHADEQFDLEEAREHLRGAGADAAQPTEQITEATKEDFFLLLKAFETVCKPAVEELGVFVAGNALRKTRNQISTRHRCLNGFSVKSSGQVILHSMPEASRSEIVAAVAEWMALFYRHCNTIIPAFPAEMASSLLDPMRSELNKLGFPEAWRKAVNAS